MASPSSTTKLVHVYRVTYTNGKVKITSDRFGDSVIVPYDSTMNSSADVAIAWMRSQGIKVVGYGENSRKGYYILSDTWLGLKGLSLGRKIRR
jgi:hypothetical protein